MIAPTRREDFVGDGGVPGIPHLDIALHQRFVGDDVVGNGFGHEILT